MKKSTWLVAWTESENGAKICWFEICDRLICSWEPYDRPIFYQGKPNIHRADEKNVTRYFGRKRRTCSKKIFCLSQKRRDCRSAFLVWLNKRGKNLNVSAFQFLPRRMMANLFLLLLLLSVFGMYIPAAISERNWQIYFFQGPCDLIWWGQCVKLQVKENFRQELPRQHGQQCRNNSLNDLKLKFLFFCPFIFLSLSRKY